MQAEYVYKKCKNEGITDSEQVYECEINDKPKVILNQIPMNVLCLMILNYLMSLLKVLK